MVVEGRKVTVEIDTTKTCSLMNPVVFSLGPAGGGGGEEGDSRDRHDQDLQSYEPCCLFHRSCWWWWRGGR